MAVLLSRSYGGFPSGVVANFTTDVEASLIIQGLATASTVASTTTGAFTSNQNTGYAAIAAAALSVVVTNSLVDANTTIVAYVSQAAADVSLLRVERIVAAAGSFTIFGTAAATATTIVKWAIMLPYGEVIKN